jgi:hypothetical protein
VARGLRLVGALLVLAGLGMVAGGITRAAAAAHEDVATVAELDVYDARLTQGVLLAAGGVFACAAGGQVLRVARRPGRLSRLGRVLLVGGYLLVAAGLVVATHYDSVGGFYAGFGLQVAGAVAAGVGGSAARPGPGPPPSHGPSGH